MIHLCYNVSKNLNIHQLLPVFFIPAQIASNNFCSTKGDKCLEQIQRNIVII